MIALAQYRKYWESMVERVDGLREAVPLTVEANMADKVGRIRLEDTPVLFYMPPSAEGKGNVDSFAEDNLCVVFVMQKYNPRITTGDRVLEETQPVAETVKRLLLADSSTGCHFLNAAPGSMSTLPETEFFGDWAGWSIAFTTQS